MTLLEMSDVSVDLGHRRCLEKVSLSLDARDMVVLVGPNGAGKSTLVRAALGLVPTANGQVCLGGDPVERLAPTERAARIAWLPQTRGADEPLTALELVAAARYRFRESAARARERGAGALARLSATELQHRLLTELSGGERQRVALAGVVAQEAPLVVLDEPANHLDPAHQIEAYSLVGDLWRDGLGILCVTHDANLAFHLGDAERIRVVGLADGQVRFELPYGSDDLPEALGDLFGLQMDAVTVDERRLLVARSRVA